MNNVNEKIRDAALSFKTAIEQMNKRNVVIIYSYIGRDETGKEVLYSRALSDSFIDSIGTCDVVKHDILNGKG